MQYAKHIVVRHMPNQGYDEDAVDQRITTEQKEVHPSTVSRVQQIVYIAYSISAGLLLTRFVFALLDANPANTVAHAVYAVTLPALAPFATLFGTEAVVHQSSRFEFDTLAAIIFYGILAWIVVKTAGINEEAARRDITD